MKIYSFNTSPADSTYMADDGCVWVTAHTILVTPMETTELYLKRLELLQQKRQRVLAESQVAINEVDEEISKHLAIGSNNGI